MDMSYKANQKAGERQYAIVALTADAVEGVAQKARRQEWTAIWQAFGAWKTFGSYKKYDKWRWQI